MRCFECGYRKHLGEFMYIDTIIYICLTCSEPSYSLIMDYEGEKDLDEIDRRLKHSGYIQSLDGSMIWNVKKNVSESPKCLYPYK
jgi:DNA-directed RNA polymerase subunit RPC12/RpoP